MFDESGDGGGGFGAVGKAGGVAEIDDFVFWEKFSDGPGDGEAPKTAIKDYNR